MVEMWFVMHVFVGYVSLVDVRTCRGTTRCFFLLFFWILSGGLSICTEPPGFVGALS